MVMLEEEHEQTAAKLRRAEETASREKARAEANSNDALEAQVRRCRRTAAFERGAIAGIWAGGGEGGVSYDFPALDGVLAVIYIPMRQ